MRPIPIILTLLLALGAVEGMAYWWMHPKPAGLGEPVLVYRPREVKAEKLKTEKLKEEAKAPAQSSSSIQNSKSNIQNFSSITPLPEVVSRALPSLRCTTGTAARIDRDDGVTIHVAFFEWDLASSTNVLEAFKHLPDECMGSIGMTLIEKAPPRSYVVRGREPGGRGQEAGDRGQEENQKSATINHQSSISPTDHRSLLTDHSLSFDHTIFRDQAGVVIHAFKGTWVSGATDLLGPGVRGGVEQWNQLRWKAALKRFRPAHARVAQGAVRGIRDPDLAWQAFEESMLVDLTFER